MAGERYEFRDPVHTFIRASDDERQIIDAEPVQRLRNIHQLAMSYLVYPGATHKRFEHSLGVMELAGRVFDIVSQPKNLEAAPADIRRSLVDGSEQVNWRRNLRIAALCHDIGHLPFSHAAEKDLLPEHWNHERITVDLIRSPLMADGCFNKLDAPPRRDFVAKLAVGAKHYPTEPLTPLQSVLSEIITGDAFGVDRMDYLLRDSLHTGVAYGRFDHFRLVETMRILVSPLDDSEPQLGVEYGGLQSAEALAMARYFMYSQVYFHRTRRIFDIHLKDFLKSHLSGGFFSTALEAHLQMTDAEVVAAMRAAARDPDLPGHDAARRIIRRQPFKLLWESSPSDIQNNPAAGEVIKEAAVREFGNDAVRRDSYSQKSVNFDFPVRRRDGHIVAASTESSVIAHLPTVAVDYVFVQPEVLPEATRWLKSNRERILEQAPADEEEE